MPRLIAQPTVRPKRIEESLRGVTSPGEWVRYSTPGPEGAEHMAICLPAFSPETVRRDAEV